MSQMYFTTVTRHPMYASEEHGEKIAEIVFEPHKEHGEVSAAILEGLTFLEIIKGDSSQVTSLGERILFGGFPGGTPAAHLPYWENAYVKMWVLQRFAA